MNKQEDLISRQAAISAICNACGKIDCDKMDKCEKLQLPPANCSEFPNNSDTISRQAAIDALEEQLDYLQMLNKYENPTAESKWYGVNWARNTIADLPSAQPEIIRCKDCRFFKRNIPCVGGHYNGCEMWLDDGNEIRVMTDDYCSKALPKEGEQDGND